MKYYHVHDLEGHQAALHRGLEVLGPDFVAQICWWCKGTTNHNYWGCEVCGPPGKGSPLGLLVNNEPAPYSVVNQVLVAAERAGA